MASTRFLLDASVFIQAARLYYAFDLAPPFWAVLMECGGNGQVLSIDRMKDELKRGKDELASWVDQHADELFVSTDAQAIIDSYRDVIAWVQGASQFFDAAKYEFAHGADGWLVAYARVVGSTVVTQEVLAREVKRRVPLPNVCSAFGVPFINTFDMLRALGVQFAQARLLIPQPRPLETA